MLRDDDRDGRDRDHDEHEEPERPRREAREGVHAADRGIPRQRRQDDDAERHADDADRDLEQHERESEGGQGAGRERRGEAVRTRNVIWVAPSPNARGAISKSALRACGSPGRSAACSRKPSRAIGRHWTSRWPIAPRTTPIARPLDAERRDEDRARRDDREVVDDRGHRGRGEPGAWRSGRSSRRLRAARKIGLEDHDPRQLDGLVELHRAEAGRDRRDHHRREHEDDRSPDAQRESMRFAIVETTRQARASSLVARRRATTGSSRTTARRRRRAGRGGRAGGTPRRTSRARRRETAVAMTTSGRSRGCARRGTRPRRSIPARARAPRGGHAGGGASARARAQARMGPR